MGNPVMQHQTYQAQAFVAQVLAATATREDPIFTAPRNVKVTRIAVTPQAATTGNTTNTKHLNVVNKGAAGAGTTEVANKDLATGVDLTAFDEAEIPLNTTYANGVEMSDGDALTLQTEKVGTGVDVGPLLVTVEYQPN